MARRLREELYATALRPTRCGRPARSAAAAGTVGCDARSRPTNPSAAGRDLRRAVASSARRSDRRAGADRAVAVDQRPQPRRRLSCGCASASPRWEEVRDAPVEEIEEAIRPGGISKVKSARIQADPRALPTDGDGQPTLDVLPATAGRARRGRCCARCPGVGRKTAACVLLFAYGLRDVPVDTHVGRVGTRLGLLPRGRAVRGAPRRDARAHAAPGRSSSCT